MQGKNGLHGVTLRAILIGLLFLSFLCLITPYNDYYIRGTFVAGNHFPIGSFFLFLILVILLNSLLRKLRREWELSSAELITIWCMMLVASGIPSSGMLRYHLFMLVSPFYFATPENGWKELFHPYLPDWLVVKNSRAVKYFYEGLPSGESVPWLEWLEPALVWTSYFLMTYFVLICISVILRKQWVEHERFTFPLVVLPAEMVKEPKGRNILNDFFKNKLMWAGFMIPVVLHTLNGLHRYFPSVPQISLYFFPDKYFTDRPWIALRPTRVFIYPIVVGVTYLLSLDVSFSFWFFYLVYKAECVIAYATGFPMSGQTLASRQEMGGYIALVVFALWIARRHLWDVIRKTFSNKYSVDDSNEPLPYRWAVIGLVLGTCIICLMAYTAGMSFWLALGVMIFFYIMSIVLTWMVVDGGLLFVFAPRHVRPSSYIMIPLGSDRFDVASHTILTFEKTLMFDFRELMMPHVMNSFKASDVGRLKRRQLLAALGLAMVVAIGVSYYSGLMTFYHKGGNNLGYWYDPEPWNRLTGFLNYPSETNWRELSFIIVGVGVMSLLLFMRYRFLWWRVHPLGYAMTTPWGPYTIWFSMFLGWLCKFIILKFGGLKAYRNFRPVFLGMVIGESIMAGIWIIVGLFTGVGYRIMPG